MRNLCVFSRPPCTTSAEYFRNLEWPTSVSVSLLLTTVLGACDAQRDTACVLQTILDHIASTLATSAWDKKEVERLTVTDAHLIRIRRAVQANPSLAEHWDNVRAGTVVYQYRYLYYLTPPTSASRGALYRQMSTFGTRQCHDGIKLSESSPLANSPTLPCYASPSLMIALARQMGFVANNNSMFGDAVTSAVPAVPRHLAESYRDNLVYVASRPVYAYAVPRNPTGDPVITGDAPPRLADVVVGLLITRALEAREHNTSRLATRPFEDVHALLKGGIVSRRSVAASINALRSDDDDAFTNFYPESATAWDSPLHGTLGYLLCGAHTFPMVSALLERYATPFTFETAAALSQAETLQQWYAVFMNTAVMQDVLADAVAFCDLLNIQPWDCGAADPSGDVGSHSREWSKEDFFRPLVHYDTKLTERNKPRRAVQVFDVAMPLFVLPFFLCRCLPRSISSQDALRPFCVLAQQYVRSDYRYGHLPYPRLIHLANQQLSAQREQQELRHKAIRRNCKKRRRDDHMDWDSVDSEDDDRESEGG